jgi:alpha-L-rhamnosidase
MQRLRVWSAFIVIMLTSAAFAAPLHLRCEYLENPLGVDKPFPHLSWQSDNLERNWRQSAYEILVASRVELLHTGSADIWDSGKTTSAESVGIVYHGPALESRRRYHWKVRVWDAAGHVSESRELAWWEMGLVHATDWKANWIRWKNPEDDADRQAIRWIWVKGQDPWTVVPETTARRRLQSFASSSSCMTNRETQFSCWRRVELWPPP